MPNSPRGQDDNLLELRRDGANRPVLETISRAAAALLGAAGSDLRPDAHFSDLGGDSLSALTFANLLHEIFDIDVPVGDHHQPGDRPAGHRRLHRHPAAARGQTADVRVGARP